MEPRQKPSRRSLDPVAPTAVAALHARRQALQTLRDIDALLAEDSPSDHAQSAACVSKASADRGPGPGVYSPHKERTMWCRNAAVTFYKPSLRHDKKTAVVIRENARQTKTPGPGSYDVQAADRVIKPRPRASSFSPNSLIQPPKRAGEAQLTELEPTRADKWLSQHREPKGAVAYKLPSDVVVGRSRDQRERLRRLRLAKTRHTRVGFYSVNHHLTERRLGSIGIVPMARSTVAILEGKVSRQAQVKTRRKLRAWASERTHPKERKGRKDADTKECLPARKPVTIQWQRARARILLKHQDARQRQINAEASPLQMMQLQDLVVHDMAKHIGRDVVCCQRKSCRVITSFGSKSVKERSTGPTAAFTVGSEMENAKRLVQFDKMIGRDEFTLDASGVFIVGQDLAKELQSSGLDTTPNDTLVRTRAPTAIITKPHASRDDRSSQPKLMLSPKYDLVQTRARGHAFLRFDNQLARDERAKEKVF